MNVFFNIATSYINIIQPVDFKQVAHVAKLVSVSDQGASADVSSVSAPKNNRRSGSLDSLGKGNLL